MKTLTILLTALCITTGGLFGQALPDEMVPLPGFAQEDPDLSAHLEEIDHIIGGGVREGSVYEDGRLIRYRSVESSTRVFTTPLSIEEVREQYVDLMMAEMQEEGMPPDALMQYRGFLESEVVTDISEGSAMHGDPDMIEEIYAREGIELPADYMDCLRSLQPRLEGLPAKAFSIEMDERHFRQRDPVPPGGYFTIVEVEVQQPHVNTMDCDITEETTIVYQAYQMKISDE